MPKPAVMAPTQATKPATPENPASLSHQALPPPNTNRIGEETLPDFRSAVICDSLRPLADSPVRRTSMGAALKITRLDHTPEALRAMAAKIRDGAQSRRLLAIAMVLEGTLAA